MNSSKLTDSELSEIVSMLPTQIHDFIASHPLDVVLAGGAIRSILSKTSVRDYDLFVSSKNDAEVLYKEIINYKHKVLRSSSAITIPLPSNVQLVHKYEFDDPRSIVHNFDLTICQAAIWYDPNEGGLQGWSSYCTKEFIRDLKLNQVNYVTDHDTINPMKVLNRIIKYSSQGFLPTSNCLELIAVKIVNHYSLSVANKPSISQVANLIKIDSDDSVEY